MNYQITREAFYALHFPATGNNFIRKGKGKFDMIDINAFWEDVLAQNRENLPAYFCKNAVIRWHCTKEQFTVDEYVCANCDYPGNWDGTIERIVECENLIISVVRVFPEDHSVSFHVTSLAEIKNGKIIALDEYWADDGEAPLWRQQMNIGKPIVM